MTNSRQQQDFDLDSRSFIEIIEALRQVLPSLKKLVEAGQGLFGKETSESCSQPCGELDALLPKVYEGRGNREHLTKLCFDDLPIVEKIGFLEIFEQYQDCQHIFSRKQWEVVYLYYHDGKTEEEIAKEIGRARTTVSDLLNRAGRKKEEHDKKLRREKFDYLKEKIAE